MVRRAAAKAQPQFYKPAESTTEWAEGNYWKVEASTAQRAALEQDRKLHDEAQGLAAGLTAQALAQEAQFAAEARRAGAPPQAVPQVAGALQPTTELANIATMQA